MKTSGLFLNVNIIMEKKRKRTAGERRSMVKHLFCWGNISETPFLCLVLSLRVKNAAGDTLCSSLCWGGTQVLECFYCLCGEEGWESEGRWPGGGSEAGAALGRGPSGGSSHCLSLPTLLLLFYPLPQHCFHFPFLSVEEDEYSGIISYQRQPLCYLLTGIF